MNFEPKSINDINDNFLKDLKEKYSIKNNTVDAVERIVELEEAEELALSSKNVSDKNVQSSNFSEVQNDKLNTSSAQQKIRSYIESRPQVNTLPSEIDTAKQAKKEQPALQKKPIKREQDAPVKNNPVKEQSAPKKKPINKEAPINKKKAENKPLNNRITVDFSFLDNAASAQREEAKPVMTKPQSQRPKETIKPKQPNIALDNSDVKKAFEFLQQISENSDLGSKAKPVPAPNNAEKAAVKKSDEITVDKIPASKSYVSEEVRKNTIKEHAEEIANRLGDSLDAIKIKFASLKKNTVKEQKCIHNTIEDIPCNEAAESAEKDFDAAKYNEDFLEFSHAAYAKERRLKKFFITGCVTLVSGLLILLILFAMSRFIPAKEIVKQNKTSEEVVAFDDEGEELKKNEVRVECSFVESHSFIAFINTYYLHWTIVASLILMGTSIICFSIYVRERGAGTISSYILSKIKEKSKK